jgi:hypothetical protein
MLIAYASHPITTDVHDITTYKAKDFPNINIEIEPLLKKRHVRAASCIISTQTPSTT